MLKSVSEKQKTYGFFIKENLGDEAYEKRMEDTLQSQYWRSALMLHFVVILFTSTAFSLFVKYDKKKLRLFGYSDETCWTETFGRSRYTGGCNSEMELGEVLFKT